MKQLLQKELASRNEDVEKLAQELTCRKRELERALDEAQVARRGAERASAAKTTFLRLVSHELRTPLHTLMLELSLFDRLPVEQHAPLRARQRETVRGLAQLVDGVLHKARLDSIGVPLSVERIDPVALVEDIVDEHRTLSTAEGLSLETRLQPDIPSLQTDRQLLRVILANLVDNALKFTTEGRVCITLSWDGERHRFEVQDTGPGIPPESRSRMFEPFEQGEDPNRKHKPGLGLGLALVRELVEALGGTVSLDDGPTGGSVFAVEVPSREAE